LLTEAWFFFFFFLPLNYEGKCMVIGIWSNFSAIKCWSRRRRFFILFTLLLFCLYVVWAFPFSSYYYIVYKLSTTLKLESEL
jgi:hypothetical protein